MHAGLEFGSVAALAATFGCVKQCCLLPDARRLGLPHAVVVSYFYLSSRTWPVILPCCLCSAAHQSVVECCTTRLRALSLHGVVSNSEAGANVSGPAFDAWVDGSTLVSTTLWGLTFV